MATLDIQIKVDPTQAVAGAKQTREALAQAEAQADRVAQAMAGVGRSFASFADAIRREQRILEGIRGPLREHAANIQAVEAMYRRGDISGSEYTATVGRLNAAIGKTPGAVNPATNAFSGLAEAIRREQQMLDQLHGPMRKAEQDLQTLEALHRKGAISLAEYNREFARLQQMAGRSTAAQTIGLAGGPGAGGANGQLSSIAAGVNAINFKQAAAGLNQAFELVNSKLKITEGTLGSVVGSAIKFGATGAQIAGPWGAAIGAVAGVVTDLVSRFDDGAAQIERRVKQIEASTLSLGRAAKGVSDEFAAFNAQIPEQSMREIEESMRRFRAEGERLLAMRPAGGRASGLAGMMGAFEPPDPSELIAWHKAVEELNASEAQLEKQHRELQKAIDDANPSIGGVRRVLEGIRKPAADARDTIVSIKGALRELTEQAGGFRTSWGGFTREWIELVRQLRDQQILLTGATAEYGDWVAQMRVRENQRKDAIEDAHKAYKRGKATIEEYTKRLRELGVEYLKLAENQRLAFGGRAILTSTDERNRLVERQQIQSLQQMGLGLQSASGFRGALPITPGVLREMGDPWGGADITPDALKPALETAQQLRSVFSGIGGAIKQATTETDHFKKAVEEMNAGALANMRELSFSIGDAFVSWITDAEFSWKKFADQMLNDLLRMGVRQLIQFGWSAAGLGGARTGMDAMVPAGAAPFLPGFRTGGDMLVGGAGAPDSKIAAFRVSPGESIHVRTPQQRRDAQAALVQRRTVVLEMPDGRRARYIDEDNAEELFIRMVDRNMPALRSRLTGR